MKSKDKKFLSDVYLKKIKSLKKKIFVEAIWC